MPDPRHPIDTLIDARWVIPVEPAATVLEYHSVAVHDGAVIAVLPTTQARERFDARTTVDVTRHAVIPGLVNLHTHAAMTLVRGLADDISLMEWLEKHIWPVELAHANRDFVHDGSLLACVEMLRGGITCFSDMYFYPESTARAALATRMRAAIGIIAVDFPSSYAVDATDYLAKGLALRDDLRGEPLLSFCLAPHAPYTVGDRTLAQVATFAAELELPVHMHLHETRDEIEQGLARHGNRPIERLDRAGLVTPQLIAVHCVHLNDEELGLLARNGAHAAHCPSSNMKLASGTARVRDMLAAGINVGLGTDGAASNNRLDLFTEMRTAALLAKNATGDATAVPAAAALRMATLAARALGLGDLIGSIEPGKRADLVAIDLGVPELAPCYDPVSDIVYAAGREHVTHVWVDGRPVVEDSRLVDVDAAEVAARAVRWRQTIRP